jgi:hypothetical protein
MLMLMLRKLSSILPSIKNKTLSAVCGLRVNVEQRQILIIYGRQHCNNFFNISTDFTLVSAAAIRSRNLL